MVDLPDPESPVKNNVMPFLEFGASIYLSSLNTLSKVSLVFPGGIWIVCTPTSKVGID